MAETQFVFSSQTKVLKKSQESGAALVVEKYVATGNDFLFIDIRGKTMAIPREELVARLCDRHWGIGADGLIFVEASGEQLSWDFFNCDGSPAEMCGNAARCMALWAHRHLQKNAIQFTTRIGQVAAGVQEGVPTVTLRRPQTAPRPISDSEINKVYLINTGVPHVVIELQAWLPVEKCREIAQRFRWCREAGAQGANVTFFSRTGPVELQAVSFERGVEDFTLSCGTGVLASAVAAAGAPGGDVRVSTPGGVLLVQWLEGSDFYRLSGPVEQVFAVDLPMDLAVDLAVDFSRGRS